MHKYIDANVKIGKFKHKETVNMFNDAPKIEVISFTPAYAKQKCTTWIPLIMFILAMGAICFAPAYMRTLVTAFGYWTLLAWACAVILTIAVAGYLTPTPAHDTYIVKAAESDLSSYSEMFDMTYRKRSQTWKLQRKN